MGGRRKTNKSKSKPKQAATQAPSRPKGPFDASSTEAIKALTTSLLFDKQKEVTNTAIPPLLLECICNHLGDDNDTGTLASIQGLSKLCYNLTTHYIYTGTLYISADKSGCLPRYIDTEDEEVTSVLEANFKASKTEPLCRSDFNPKYSAAYQAAYLTRFRHIIIESWPSSDLSCQWATTMSDIQGIVPFETVFLTSVTKVEVAATALTAGDQGVNTLSDCMVGARVLSSVLGHGKYQICIDLPEYDTLYSTPLFANAVADTMAPISITYHNVTDHRLPFGNLQTMEHRYMFMPTMEIDIGYRARQMANVREEFTKALGLRDFHRTGTSALPADLTIDFVQPGTSIGFLSDDNLAIHEAVRKLLPARTSQNYWDRSEAETINNMFSGKYHIADSRNRSGGKTMERRRPCEVCARKTYVAEKNKGRKE